MYHEVETDSLLPVYVRVANGKFLAVPPPDLHTVARRQFPHEEEKVVTVDGSVRLEEEVADKQVSPVGGAAGTGEARVLRRGQVGSQSLSISTHL